MPHGTPAAAAVCTGCTCVSGNPPRYATMPARGGPSAQQHSVIEEMRKFELVVLRRLQPMSPPAADIIRSSNMNAAAGGAGPTGRRGGPWRFCLGSTHSAVWRGYLKMIGSGFRSWRRRDVLVVVAGRQHALRRLVEFRAHPLPGHGPSLLHSIRTAVSPAVLLRP